MARWTTTALFVCGSLTLGPVAAAGDRPIRKAPEAVASQGADTCEAARVISAVPMIDVVDITTASTDASEAIGCYNGKVQKGVWYQFTPDVTGTYFITTEASPSFGTVEVFSGTCGSLSLVACNGGPRTFTAGTTYKLLVSSFDGAATTLVLRACTPPAVPVITTGTVCPGSTGNAASTPDAGDGTTYSWTITRGTITSGQGTSAIVFSADEAAFSSETMNVSVRATSPDGCFRVGSTSISLGSSLISAAGAVAPNSTGNPAEIATSTNPAMAYNWSITNGAITGGAGTRAITYTAGATGFVDLAVVSTPSGCGSSVTANASIPIRTFNSTSDACASPQVITTLPNISVQNIGTATSEAFDTASCFPCQQAYSTVWYEYTPVANGPFTVHTVGSNRGSSTSGFVDTAIAAYTGACGTLTEIACNYDESHERPFNNQSAVTIDGVASTTYRVLSGMECQDATDPTALLTTFHAGAVGAITVTAPQSICTNTPATALVPDQGAGSKYYWDVWPGRVISGGRTNTVTFSLDGTAPGRVGLYAVDPSGLLMYGVAVVAVQSSSAIDAPNIIVEGGTATAAVPTTAGASYAWTILNGTITTATDTSKVDFTAGTSGNVRLGATVVAPGCQSQTTVRNVAIVASSAFNNCKFDLLPIGTNYASGATTDSLQVTTAAECAWSATVPSGSFVSIDSGSPHSGDGTVAYSVAANATGSSRSTTISIGGKNFVVTQSASGDTPVVLSATASPSSVALTWTSVTGAMGYRVFRSSNGRSMTIVTTSAPSYSDSTITPGTGYLYQIAAIDSLSNTLAYSNTDLSVPTSYTDSDLGPGTTIKAAHFGELRSAVNAARMALDWLPLSFTGSVSSGVSVSGAHLMELRSAIDSVRAAIGLGAISYTDSSITPVVTPIRAAHLLELRSGLE